MNIDFAIVFDAASFKRFVNRLIGVDKLHVFAHKGDIHFALLRAQRAGNDVSPWREVSGFRHQIQRVADDLVEHLIVQHLRHFKDRINVRHRNDGTLLDVRKERNLFLFVFWNWAIRATEQHIWEYPDFAQFLHAVLRRLGLQLASTGDVRHQRQMDVAAVFATNLNAHLADGLHERQ